MPPLICILKCHQYEKGHFKDDSEGEAEATSLQMVLDVRSIFQDAD
jgi:hypothetical protein